MFKGVFLGLVLVCALAQAVFAQQMQDVVYLKDGSVIRGTIIEQVPNVSLKIQAKDGSVFVYKMDDIMKITKELLSKKEVVEKKENGLFTLAGSTYIRGTKVVPRKLEETDFTRVSPGWEEEWGLMVMADGDISVTPRFSIAGHPGYIRVVNDVINESVSLGMTLNNIYVDLLGRFYMSAPTSTRGRARGFIEIGPSVNFIIQQATWVRKLEIGYSLPISENEAITKLGGTVRAGMRFRVTEGGTAFEIMAGYAYIPRERDLNMSNFTIAIGFGRLWEKK